MTRPDARWLQRTTGGVASALLLAGALALGCSPESPQGDELAAPQEREAVPFEAEEMGETEAERQREQDALEGALDDPEDYEALEEE